MFKYSSLYLTIKYFVLVFNWFGITFVILKFSQQTFSQNSIEKYLIRNYIWFDTWWGQLTQDTSKCIASPFIIFIL